ncbi:MAG: hypothetical protein UY50_C0016G0010 [Parcubacteria group bacterium GW2011_GWA2_49_9]|nr:MAG: hypothetical protein UY50_C0016G0010 [Parcubacteria group bacterium GW2011_GWA2_49_9]
MSFASFRRFSKTALFSVYLLSFFYTLHVALPVYVNSTFLASLVPERFVGLIFTISSLLTIVALITIPRMLKAVGDYFTTVFFIAGEIACLIGIAASNQPAVIVTLFILSSVLISLIYFDLDLIVEGYSKDTDTGSIRGLYLTSANIAWVIAPALSSVLLIGDGYWRVYIVAAALFIPSLFIFARRLEQFKDPLYRTVHFTEGVKKVWHDKDLRQIFWASFLLYFFFTVMTIYTPIYLHEHLGFAWKELGIMFSIMLVPFLLLEAPLGRLADKVLGEKELLVAGFAIIALSTTVISFMTIPTFVLFALILFTTRVGAAMVEIMTETYFFKKIRAGDAQVVGLMRALRPVAGAIAPVATTILLSFLPIQYMFVALGAVMLIGVPVSLGLKDTR